VGDRSSILVEGETVWRIATAGRLAFIVDGAEYFAALRDALCRAHRSVLILAWVIDSRLQMLRDGASDGRPSELAAFLADLVAERPELHIRIDCWDHSVIYTLDRELLTRVRLGWTSPERVHFELGNHQPPGASLHEKVVVIDDEVAFIGGLDLGMSRWDTREHLPDDPRRVTPIGEPYPPFHDLQVVVSGEAARALGEHARRRWKETTGESVESVAAEDDCWPATVEPVVENVEVGLVRTRAAWGDQSEVLETKRLHRRLIAEAREHIFIENQYLTEDDIGRQLAERLRGEDPPDVVAVTSRESEKWLEHITMSGLRARWCRELMEADLEDRFGVYCPVLEDGTPIMVHSKLVCADDRLLYLGSANLAKRSMHLDTECGIAIDGSSRADVRQAIRGFRRGLLAEHLGTTPAAVAERERRLSLKRTVEALAGGPRTLAELPIDEQEIPAVLEPLAELADLYVFPSASKVLRAIVTDGDVGEAPE
jgi:phospholipase D1/2